MNRLVFFFQSSTAGGIILMLASVLGIILANSSFSDLYFNFLNTHVGPLTVSLWVNDALMAIFFLLVGLEVKREMMHGQLKTNADRLLPGIAALFGVIVPALIYMFFTHSFSEYIRGWAVPTATDIAFALGVVAILGNKVPTSLKVFLTALAIIDDLMAIIVIALFYTDQLNFLFLFGAVMVTGILIYINKKDYARPISYIILGVLLWVCLLKSGLHATLAGVILALTIPYHSAKAERQKTEFDSYIWTYKHTSPLVEWEHSLSNIVTFIITPIFGFVNAGVSFAEITLADFANPMVLGITLGLFIGKQVGVFGTVFTLVKMKIVKMPEGASWIDVYGVALLCGIGFTMSLFVSLLAYNTQHAQETAKLGIFAGSIISAVTGYIVLKYLTPNKIQQ